MGLAGDFEWYADWAAEEASSPLYTRLARGVADEGSFAVNTRFYNVITLVCAPISVPAELNPEKWYVEGQGD